LELGWEKKDFPSKWNPRWHALVKQPRELTPHRTSIALASLHSVVKYFLSAVWKILRPKLETILQEHALAQAQDVIRIRRDQREAEFEPFWDEFVVSRSWDLTPPWALPRFVDACELPAIDRMLAEDESKIPVTAERWKMAIDLRTGFFFDILRCRGLPEPPYLSRNTSRGACHPLSPFQFP